MNKVILIVRLTKELVVAQTENWTDKTSGVLAVKYA